MSSARLHVTGLGVVTGDVASAGALAEQMGVAWKYAGVAMEERLLRGADALSALATRALWEANAMATTVPQERTALLVLSGWGTVESTLAYLESMLAEEGKFASPRHFTRSVHSSVASFAAIALDVHGPCETLAFDGDAVAGALGRAAMLLEMGRAGAVLVCWADEKAEIVPGLVRRAVRDLGRRELEVFGEVAAGGAVAVRVERGGGFATIEATERFAAVRGKGVGAYPMDGAVGLAMEVVRSAAAG